MADEERFKRARTYGRGSLRDASDENLEAYTVVQAPPYGGVVPGTAPPYGCAYGCGTAPPYGCDYGCGAAPPYGSAYGCGAAPPYHGCGAAPPYGSAYGCGAAPPYHGCGAAPPYYGCGAAPPYGCAYGCGAAPPYYGCGAAPPYGCGAAPPYGCAYGCGAAPPYYGCGAAPPYGCAYGCGAAPPYYGCGATTPYGYGAAQGSGTNAIDTVTKALELDDTITKPPELDAKTKLYLIAKARELDENLRACYGKDIAWENTSTYEELFVPTIYGGQKYWYMGRSLFARIKDFIAGLKHLRHGATDDNKAPGVITGTPGSGKTTALVTVVGYLREAWRNTSKKVVYINGEDFVRNPIMIMWESLVLAYIHDIPADLKTPTWSEEYLLFWIHSRASERLYFIVDDANAFDIDKLGAASGLLRERAYNFIKKIEHLHVVIYCSSLGSIWRHKLVRDKVTPYMMVTGGYNEEEFKAYCRHELDRARVTLTRAEDPILGYCNLRQKYNREWDANDCDEYRLSDFKTVTGWVPRLVAAYGTESIVLSFNMYRTGIEEFVKDALKNSFRWSEFVDVAGGLAKIETDLPKALDSRCFYRDAETKRGRCISDGMLAYTLAIVTQTTEYNSELEAASGIGKWTALVANDDNSARVGWNSEIATLLFIKHYGLVIQEGNFELNFSPQIVKIFHGDFSLRSDGKSYLFVPGKFNHPAVDLIGEDANTVLGVQIATGVDAVLKHSTSLSRFLEMTSGDPRKKVLVWILSVDDADRIRIRSSEEYTEVFVCFGRLSRLLRRIDETCCKLHLRSSTHVKEATSGAEREHEVAELRQFGRCASLQTSFGKPCRRLRGDRQYCHYHEV